MKPNWKTIGIATITAAALVYPAILLYRFMRKKMDENKENGEADGEHHVMKAFSPAYRGKHKPHHRHN